MKILILGGSSPTGIAIIEACLVAKYTKIIVYVRSPEKIPECISTNPVVEVITGQVYDKEALGNAMDGVEAVFSVLGPKLFRHPTGCPISRLYETIIDVIVQKRIKRLVAICTASFPDPNDKFSLQLKIIVDFVYVVARNAYNDVVATGKLIREKGDEAGLDYTLPRIAILGNAESSDYVAGYIGDGKTASYISRNAVAKFFIEELEQRNWVGKAPYISSL